MRKGESASKGERPGVNPKSVHRLPGSGYTQINGDTRHSLGQSEIRSADARNTLVASREASQAILEDEDDQKVCIRLKEEFKSKQYPTIVQSAAGRYRKSRYL